MSSRIEIFIILLLFFSSCQKEVIEIDVDNDLDETMCLELVNRYNYDIPNQFTANISVVSRYGSDNAVYVYSDCQFVKQESGNYKLEPEIILPFSNIKSIRVKSFVNDNGWNLDSYRDYSTYYYYYSLDNKYVLDMTCGHLRMAYVNTYDVTDTSASFTFKIEDFGYDTISYQGVYLDTVMYEGLYLPIEKQIAESNGPEQCYFHFSDLESNRRYYLRVFKVREFEEEIQSFAYDFTTEEE